MNKERIEISLVKATYEELQQVICELQVEKYIKDKEIKRLNNIIKEAIEYIEKEFEEVGCRVSGSDLPYSYIDELLNILKGSENHE